MDLPDNYQTTYGSKTKIVVFYSLNDGTSYSSDGDNMEKYVNLDHK